jgi:hypothetical protein
MVILPRGMTNGHRIAPVQVSSSIAKEYPEEVHCLKRLVMMEMRPQEMTGGRPTASVQEK